ncbi:MAG TPA: hypothetical protein VEW25_11900 [Allosphingosinicella sp.]|nr:hypothetical protein [Allosphingosinicella sp.]
MAEQGRVGPHLRLCRGCRRFTNPDEIACPFCHGDMDALQAEHDALQEEVRQAADALRAAMAEARARRDA